MAPSLVPKEPTADEDDDMQKNTQDTAHWFRRQCEATVAPPKG